MNYTKLSVTCLDSFHHIYTVHYLSLKSPKIKFTSNISSRWCHCWFSSWFIEAWIITSVKRCTLSTVKLMVFKWRKVLVFKWRKKREMFILHIIYTQNRIPKCFLNMECNKTNIQRRERIQNLFLYSTREYSFIHSFPVTTLSWSGQQWIRSLSQEHWAQGGNTLRLGHPSIIGYHAHINPHTHSQLMAIYGIQCTSACFWDWEETREPTGLNQGLEPWED